MEDDDNGHREVVEWVVRLKTGGIRTRGVPPKFFSRSPFSLLKGSGVVLEMKGGDVIELRENEDSII